MKLRYLSVSEIADLAEKIGRLADAERVVKLKPDTARICEEALRALSSHPPRATLVAIICGVDNCPMRRDCYNCFTKANVIMRLYAGEKF